VIAQAFDELKQAGCLDELKERFERLDTAGFLADLDKLGLRGKLEKSGFLENLEKNGLLERVEPKKPLGKDT
jgi:hypothetical protein